MKKDLGIMPAVYPMPVLMVAAYDESGRVNVMNAAWGMICDMDKIALFIGEGHKTTQNILKTKAFTVSIADRDHMDVADYFGIATGNKTPDKFERTGYHAVRSSRVNAPVIDEFPVAMECELAEVVETETMYCIVGKRRCRGECPQREWQSGPCKAQRPYIRPVPERLLRHWRAGGPCLERRCRTGQSEIIQTN